MSTTCRFAYYALPILILGLARKWMYAFIADAAMMAVPAPEFDFIEIES
jgi:hypothetical protein